MKFKKASDKGTPVHAEVDAINKLKPFPLNRKRLKKVSIVIVRFSVFCELRCSKPCIKCLSAIVKQLPKKGYILKDVYYSDIDDQIHKKNIKDLILNSKLFISSFWRNKSMIERDFNLKKFKIGKKLIRSVQ